MPLKKGTSKKTISANIGEMMRSFKKTGKIGASRPKTVKKAQKQAVAASMRNARKPKKRR